MKRMLMATGIMVMIMTEEVLSQTPGQARSVLLSAVVQANPPQIMLKWEPISGASAFTIYRKAKTDMAWGSAVASGLPGTATSWVDTNVQIGQAYEYRVVKTGGTTAMGYIYAGIEVPETFYRGKILLVYDTISTAGLSGEITRWEEDAEGDGWEVIKIPVHQNDPVTDVKNKIVNAYNTSPQQVKAVFLLGRVPVPYSGELAPDGHTDHIGAWPADGYYADIDGIWTDSYVNNTSAAQSRNHNVPGDGKFDPSEFPTLLELQIGRVDMRNLPAFSQTEQQLLKKYLDKNHAYRHKYFTTLKQGLIDDNFTSYSEGFSASAWRSFSAICHASQIVTTDYFTTMSTSPYQWSYGCGAGSYTSCSGIGNTSNFAADSLQSVFTMLFGSYFGDWDSPSNNLLRAALANGSTLTNCWSGRPYWHFHHMALGENIGFSALMSMNNSTTYHANNSQTGVHMALMGDPTLRNDVVAPVQNLTADYINGHAVLTWTASPDNVLGYNIYRKNDTFPQYEKINSQWVTGLTYIDTCLMYPGVYKYMVRAVQLEQTNAGTYYNMSTGITDTLYNPNYNPVVADFSFTQIGNQIFLVNNSLNATDYFWNFGDGNTSTQESPVHTYSAAGVYTIMLIASSACGSDTMLQTVTVFTGINEQNTESVLLYPNPSAGKVYVKLIDGDFWMGGDLEVIDATGRMLYFLNLKSREAEIDLTILAEGLYYFRLVNDNKVVLKPFVLKK